ncbi:hypothetical protein OEA41_005226 [Lepraria neglecta]|uniref:Uncharacterized protein n=1 Tax=Lepraria neglecta TaxID=209136 RepID=A0AAE0DJ01_9LECA|nr:hypothetical protein OEA41_005226 [Lepraria neglecta]
MDPSISSTEVHAKTGLLVTEERSTSDDSRAATPSLNAARHGKPTLMNSLGYYIIATTLGGTIVIGAALVFLCFLHVGNCNNSTWRSIMTAGWAARSITLASLAIRFVVTAQAAGAISMLAALALSRFEVPLARSAAMSMMRFEITGPHNLARIYTLRLLRGKNIAIGLAALCLTCTTLLLQFASTVLLSNLKLRTITGAGQTAMMPYGIKNGDNGNDETEPLENSAHYWSTRPAGYPAFAEYTEPTPTVEDGVYMSIRALLPIYPEANRDRLKNYQGHGNLVDTRIVCMRPVIEDLELTPPPRAGLDDFFNEDSFGSVAFNCSSAIQGFDNTSRATTDEWPVVLCLLHTYGGIVSDMDGYDKLNTGVGYLVINTTGSYDNWSNVYSGGFGALDLEPAKNDGEWLAQDLIGTDLTISFSVYFSAFTA